MEPSASPWVVRLSHAQWEQAVRDLFYLDQPSGLSGRFRSDSRPGETYHFDRHAESLSVDQELYLAYGRSVAELADRIVTQVPTLERIGALEDARGFLSRFGPRAFRRPLTAEETSVLAGVYDEGPALYPGLDARTASVRHTLEVMLRSPFFLYRIEQGAAPSGGVIPLNDWEVASRLSFALWDSIPDDALFAAAAAGEVSTPAQVESQARRMLDDPRAASVIQSFHRQVYRWDELEQRILASEGEHLPAGFSNASVAESELFVRSHIFEDRGGIRSLLTSLSGHVNGMLSDVYDLGPSDGGPFEPVEFRAEPRPGLFSRSLFLSGMSLGGEPDIIHRGLFMLTRALCEQVPSPPPDATLNLPAPQGATNRERTASLTSAPSCQACHRAINSYGYAFEHYGGDGSYRVTDDGSVVDASSELRVGSELISVEDASDLLGVMAESFEAHVCYVQHWHDFVFGRAHVNADNPLIAQLAAASLESDAPIKEMLARMVSANSFLNRSAEAL